MARLTSRPAADADVDRVDGTAARDTGDPPAVDAARDPAAGAASGPGSRPASAGDEPSLTVAVLAQRQALVDGVAVGAALDDLGGGRHVLERGSARTAVVLEAPHRVAGRAGQPRGPRRRLPVRGGGRARAAGGAARAGDAGRATAAGGGPLEVRAVIPGKVVAVSVVAGDRVVAGQQLLVVEAMKMQNELRAPPGMAPSSASGLPRASRSRSATCSW